MRSPMLGWLLTGIVILIVLLVWFLTIRNGQKLIEDPNGDPVPYGMYVPDNGRELSKAGDQLKA